MAGISLRTSKVAAWPRAGLAPLVLCLAIAAIVAQSGPVHAQDGQKAQTWQPSKTSGPELIRQLGDAKTRLAAFRELARRTSDVAREKLNSAEVIVCPQEGGKKPIYIVLSNSDFVTTTTDLRSSGYPAENPVQLFGPPPEYPEVPIYPHGKFDRRDDLVIYAFTAEGKPIAPFGGDNMLDAGIIADMNGDGLMELADMQNCGVNGIKHVNLLNVCAVAEHSKPLLRVLYNWGPNNDWDYQFADRDNDGKMEIEFGPVIAPDVVKPKVVFVWNKAKGGYVVEEGGQNSHLLVLPWNQYDDSTQLWEEFDRLKQQKLVFPIDPDAKGVSRNGTRSLGSSSGTSRREPTPPPAKPYRQASLKAMTNAELVAYMSRGKTGDDFHRENLIPTQLPKDFWTLPAKKAALALVEANRTATHRRAFLLAIDDRDGRQPPESCSIFYSSLWCQRLENNGDYFLRVEPRKSYFALCQGFRTVHDFVRIRRGAAGLRPPLRRTPLRRRQARRRRDLVAQPRADLDRRRRQCELWVVVRRQRGIEIRFRRRCGNNGPRTCLARRTIRTLDETILARKRW